MSGRDLHTEALGAAAFLLGWHPHEMVIEEWENEIHRRFITNPRVSRFGLCLDLTKAYEPECLLVDMGSSANSKSHWFLKFQEGLRTSPEKLQAVRQVNRNLARGPVTLDYEV